MGASVSLLRMQGVAGADTAVLGEVEVHAAIVPSAGKDEEGNRRTADKQKVENAKEDEALCGANDIGALGNGKSNWVQEPENVDVARKDAVVSANLDARRRVAATPKGLVSQNQIRKGAKGIEAPFVTRSRVGRAEVGNDPDPGQEDIEDNRRPANSTDQAKGNDDNGKGNDPEDVLGKEDLVRRRIASVEVRRNDRVCEARGHGKVADGAGEESNDEEIVKDPFVIARSEAEREADEKDRPEDTHNSPKPARSSRRKVRRSGLWVDPERVVASVDGIHGKVLASAE